MKNPDLVTLTLQMTEKDKEMIKADAKALGMVPSKYMTMLARCVNMLASETDMAESAAFATGTVLREVLNK